MSQIEHKFQPKAALLVGAGLLLGLAVGALIPLVSGSDQLVVAMALLTLAILAAPLLQRGLAGGVDPFEPVLWFAVVWGLMFVMRPLVMTATGDTWLRGTYDVSGGMAPAMALGILGAVAFLLAYELVARRVPAEPSAGADRWSRRPPATWVVLGALGVAVAGMLAIGGVNATQIARSDLAAYEYLAPLVAVPAIVLLLLKHRAGSGWALPAALGMALWATVYFFFFGKRSFVLLPASVILVYAYAALGRRPRWATLGLVGALIVLPMFTIIEIARTDPTQSPLETVDRSQVGLGSSLERFASGDSTAMFPALALQMQTEGTMWDQRPGHEIASVSTRWVPESLWPEKPLSSSEILYSRYFPNYHYSNPSGTLFTLVSEFYYDSGLIGVVLGMGLVGAAFALLWRRFLAAARNPWAWALFSPVLPMSLLVFRGDLALCFGLSIFVFGPLLAAYLASPRRAA